MKMKWTTISWLWLGTLSSPFVSPKLFKIESNPEIASDVKGLKIIEEANFHPSTSEIKTSIGLNYNDQDIVGKRFIW